MVALFLCLQQYNAIKNVLVNIAVSSISCLLSIFIFHTAIVGCNLRTEFAFPFVMFVLRNNVALSHLDGVQCCFKFLTFWSSVFLFGFVGKNFCFLIKKNEVCLLCYCFP